jgi:hypothetical protein
VSFTSGSVWRHTVVVYGDNDDGSVSVMDPALGLLVDYPLSKLNPPVFIGHSEYKRSLIGLYAPVPCFEAGRSPCARNRPAVVMAETFDNGCSRPAGSGCVRDRRRRPRPRVVAAGPP